MVRTARVYLAIESAPVAGNVLAQRLSRQQLHLGALRLLHCLQQVRQHLCILACSLRIQVCNSARKLLGSFLRLWCEAPKTMVCCTPMHFCAYFMMCPM